MPAQLTTPSDSAVVITRQFDAPRQLVFDCYTKPELVKRWLSGPPGWSMPVCQIDLRVGGKYRYELKGPNGESMGFGGIYRVIDAPARIAANEKFDEDWTGGETRTQSDFVEADDMTTVTFTIEYASKAARDAALTTGMVEGMEAGFRTLDTVLAELSAG
jgi:uncharacterized protein YndB with AHSA1/START domain